MPEGYIRGLAQYYADGVERMEIWIAKSLASSLPHRDNQRIPVALKIGETIYAAGIRSTPANAYVWICPDLKNEFGRRVSLASALINNGYLKNQLVSLDVEDNKVSISQGSQ
jgi:hypothetical protein